MKRSRRRFLKILARVAQPLASAGRVSGEATATTAPPTLGRGCSGPQRAAMMFSHATSPSGKALRMPGQQQKQPHDAPATEQQRPSKGSSSRLVGGGKQQLYNESIGGGGGGGGGGRVERCMQCAKLGSAAVFVVAVSCFALQYRAATATVTATFARLDAEPSVFDCGAVGGTHPVGIARADSGNFCCAGRCGDECGQSNCTRRFSERECCGSSISRVGAYCDGNWPAPCIPFR